jgi:hypothetical protein
MARRPPTTGKPATRRTISGIKAIDAIPSPEELERRSERWCNSRSLDNTIYVWEREMCLPYDQKVHNRLETLYERNSVERAQGYTWRAPDPLVKRFPADSAILVDTEGNIIRIMHPDMKTRPYMEVCAPYRVLEVLDIARYAKENDIPARFDPRYLDLLARRLEAARAEKEIGSEVASRHLIAETIRYLNCYFVHVNSSGLVYERVAIGQEQKVMAYSLSNFKALYPQANMAALLGRKI